jgi:ABC-2 type transport system ATP-binding protein
MAVINISHLKKYYGKHRGIEDVSFSVEEGEIFGFIGPNGAGKSTTIRILLSLIYPDGGTATIFGKDCIRNGAEIRRQIGYLPSEVFYYENMKVIDVLKYSASFYAKVNPARIRELAEAMELDLAKRVSDLSYGNKKKVGIVQGLLHEPKLIILDEPTSGLDPLMQQRFFDLIAAENQKGATVLFSSHILPEVQKLCSRVAIIRDGLIVKVEDMKTLRNEKYKRFAVEFGEAEELPPDLFQLTGIVNRETDGATTRFLYGGDINLVLERLHGRKVVNLLVEEPSLEEIFLHYYRREDEA